MPQRARRGTLQAHYMVGRGTHCRRQAAKGSFTLLVIRVTAALPQAAPRLRACLENPLVRQPPGCR